MTYPEQRAEPEPDAAAHAEQPSVRQPSATIGTGSSIAVGCVILVVVFMVIAVAIRAFTPFW